MKTDTITTIQNRHRKVKPTEVLWGAWVDFAGYDEETKSYDFEGIYDTISKKGKEDFPFIVDLKLVMQCQADVAEFNQEYVITLDFIGRYGIKHIFKVDRELPVYESDIPYRWYEYYEFNNILIPEPDYYELLISIEKQFEQRIPLWVVAPKMILIDEETGSTTEMWPEDLDI